MSWKRQILGVSTLGGLGGVGGVAELDPLTWTWMHSSLAPDRDDGIPPEGWSTWAGPA